MRKTLLTALTFLALAHYTNAQNIYLGAEAAATLDFYKLEDPIGKQLKDAPPLSGTWGFTVRRDNRQKTFIETGVLLKSYYESIGFKSFNGTSSDEEIKALLILLRVGKKFNLKKEKLFLVLVV